MLQASSSIEISPEKEQKLKKKLKVLIFIQLVLDPDAKISGFC
jgi:hypothetical protein